VCAHGCIQLGLDEQDPADWDDKEVTTQTDDSEAMTVVDLLSEDEEEEENAEQEVVLSTSRDWVVPEAVLATDSDEDDEDDPLSYRAKRARTEEE
jgi:hypothetical protein